MQRIKNQKQRGIDEKKIKNNREFLQRTCNMFFVSPTKVVTCLGDDDYSTIWKERTPKKQREYDEQIFFLLPFQNKLERQKATSFRHRLCQNQKVREHFCRLLFFYALTWHGGFFIFFLNASNTVLGGVWPRAGAPVSVRRRYYQGHSFS